MSIRESGCGKYDPPSGLSPCITGAIGSTRLLHPLFPRRSAPCPPSTTLPPVRSQAPPHANTTTLPLPSPEAPLAYPSPPQACKQAYAHYAKSARLGRFTMEEERRLTRLVEAAAAAQAAAPRPPAAAGELYRNLPWSAISDLFPGRTANHLRAAWQRLAPHRMARVAVGPREDLQVGWGSGGGKGWGGVG